MTNDRRTASLAVYVGRHSDVTEYPTIETAVSIARDLVRFPERADDLVMAVVRDSRGVMIFAADSEGRTWHRGDDPSEVADWSREVRA